MAADSGMETCPSPEIADSRKRPLDCDAENGATKRSHYGSGGDGTYHLKVLVPGVAAGAIIGKGGDTIAQLQKDTGAKVKISKSHDFYPGTTERVCLITGSLEAIMAVMDFIMDKIREKPDLTLKTTVDSESGKTTAERDKQVKILVPNSTAGMIIGKAGNYIKQIKEESGSYVQISQKAKDVSLQERCITVIGEKENNRNALMMILAKVADDPQSGICPNVSYADVSGPVANYNPTGSPYAQAPTSTPTYTSTAGINTVSLLNGAGLSLNLNLGAAITAGTAPVTTQLLEHIKLNLRTAGFSEPAATEILSAIATLAKYNLLGMGIGMPSSMSYLGNPMDSTTTANGSNNNGGVFGPIGTVPALGSTSPTPRNTLDRYEAFDPFRQNNTAASAIHLNNNSFGLGTNQLSLVSKSPTQVDVNNKETKKVDIEIAEVIVGAILGPGGRALIEIQHLSGANIQISKKGMFAPGTRNRIVTITGYPNAINTAQYLIEQRISEEEAKRARQNALASMIN
ncbi:RNA-binding protein Nova-1-like protein passilla isoform X1 [Megachile rotundata]|uniref:RNA-binding protein Nova-1-like protein passilla isoform X1 n=1 Tax=Megachile rotundata TaxID=143995 RepID=UPI000258F2D2|nr:PREDICTED: RNA-binding protein Nova-1 isoform X1 [Megachile rotundata]